MKIDQAIKHFGSRAGLAAALGVSRQAIQQWVDKGEIPELRQYKLRDILAKQSPQTLVTPFEGSSPR